MPDEVRPTGHSREALIAEVRRRAARRRLHRRTALAGVATLAIAVAVAVPLALVGDGRPSTINVVAPPTTSSSSTDVVPSTTTESSTTTSTPPVASNSPPLSPTATFAGLSDPGTWTGVEPTSILFSADGGNIVGGIRWASWTDRSAVGSGTWGYNDCQPACAGGTITHYPATIELSAPSHGQFTSLTEIQSGPHGHTYNFTLPSQVVRATTDVSGVCSASASCPYLVVAPGSQIAVEGTCPTSATTLQIVASASRATGRVLYNGGIGKDNGFSIPVAMPDMGESTATITAECQPGSAVVVEARIEYASPSNPTIPSTTTTTLPSCGQFTSTVTTDRSSYSTGQTVSITITVTNAGPACSGKPPMWCGADASAYNSANQDVWDWGASPSQPSDIRNCPMDTGPETIAHNSSATVSTTWQQDQCTFDPSQTGSGSNPDCPQTQVPAGVYKISANGSSTGQATITIAP